MSETPYDGELEGLQKEDILQRYLRSGYSVTRAFDSTTQNADADLVQYIEQLKKAGKVLNRDYIVLTQTCPTMTVEETIKNGPSKTITRVIEKPITNA